MNKKNNLAFVALFLVGLISSLTINTFAQQKTWVEGEQPQKVIAEDNLLQNYIKISSLPMNKKSGVFSDLSAEDKAALFKLHLALQFVKRQNLTKHQKDIILQSISTVSSDTYNKTKDRKNTEMSAQTLQARATSIFSQREAFEIFASLGGNEEDVGMLRKYQIFSDLKTKTIYRFII